jgi:hypothetical protein
MTEGRLPDDGELQLGSVRLPAGRQIESGTDDPLVWATLQPVPDVGSVWSALSDAHQETGLVPFARAGLEEEGKLRPWDNGEFYIPFGLNEIDRLDAAEVLAPSWWADGPAEWGLEPFPGLAPAEDRPLAHDRLREALGALPPARLALAVASRPADVLPLIGWEASDRFPDSPPIAAVLRSWEDRFGARLLQVGFARLVLLVRRPPHSLETARWIAAEHIAFADECGLGLTTVSDLATTLVDAPTWSFWWD